MKNILILTALLGTVAFGAEKATPARTPEVQGMKMNQGKFEGNGKNRVSSEKINEMEEKVNKFITQNDQNILKNNRNEIKGQMESGNPDWNTVKKLDDQNTLIMSKARVQMMKEAYVGPNRGTGNMGKNPEQNRKNEMRNKKGEPNKVKGNMAQNRMSPEKTRGRRNEFLSKEDQSILEINRAEFNRQRGLENPDWDKIQKLNDESALIMSKGRLEMMKKFQEMKK